jgi:hypothetical protein
LAKASAAKGTALVIGALAPESIYRLASPENRVASAREFDGRVL